MNLWAATTEERKIEIGGGRGGSGYSYIDLIGDTTYTDYGLRLIRGNGGANTTSDLMHRGTGNFAITAVDAANLLLKTQGTTRMTIGSDGKVGIGTASGSYLVNLSGNNGIGIGGVRTISRDSGTSGTIHIGTGADSFTGNISFDTNGASRMLILNDGKVGIGTAPDYALQVNGAICPKTNGQELGASSLRWDLNAETITCYNTITIDTPADYDQTAVTSLATAPIVVPRVNVGYTSSFLPFLHQSAQYSEGWVTHMNLGLYKQASSFGKGTTGFYVALGGNDNYPTEYFTLAYGGYIKHSGGAITMEGAKILLPDASTLATSGAASQGTYVKLYTGSSVVNGMKCVYLDSGGAARACNADSTSTMPCVAINGTNNALSAKTQYDFLTHGIMWVNGWSLTPGAKVYVGTDGYPTTVQPSGSGDVVQCIGHAISAKSFLFNPSPDYVVLA
jgi:hypothetical protein